MKTDGLDDRNLAYAMYRSAGMAPRAAMDAAKQASYEVEDSVAPNCDRAWLYIRDTLTLPFLNAWSMYACTDFRFASADLMSEKGKRKLFEFVRNTLGKTEGALALFPEHGMKSSYATALVAFLAPANPLKVMISPGQWKLLMLPDKSMGTMPLAVMPFSAFLGVDEVPDNEVG
jgi:hypothetical protein